MGQRTYRPPAPRGTLLFPALLCLAAAASGQPPSSVATRDLPPLDPALTFTEVTTELVVPALDVTGGWLELTPLVGDREAAVVILGDRRGEDGEERLRSGLEVPGLPAEPAMLCSGGEPWAVTCDEVYLERRVTMAFGSVDPVEIEVRFETGVEAVGRYMLDDWPVAGARVAVVPADLEAPRPFTLPLGPDRAGEMRREVLSDADGRFALPALAAGEYFLETLLPSGRVHRSDPFELPSETALRTAAAVDDVTPVAWDLGDIDVADGLVVELRVRDPEGQPIAGAVVAGRQGNDPLTYVNYETTTGTDGNARMSGFTVDEPVHLSCRAEGYATVEERHELLPVVVLCTLEPLAAVRGEVSGPAGLAIAGAVVSLRPAPLPPPAAGEPSPPAAEPRPIVQPADAGEFFFDALEAGTYALVAAAPGYEVEEQTFTLAAGERRSLESIVLLPGKELRGRVVDADGGAPIAGAEIRAVEPAGAAWAVSGGDGAFALASRSDRPLRLTVSAEGYAAAEVEVTLKPGRFVARPPPLVVELEKAGWIRAVIWDEDRGFPCRGCRLVIAPGRRAAEELLTDGRGEALSGPLREGWYRVRRPRVDHLGSTVIVEPEHEVRQVKVEPGRVATVRFGDRQQAVRVRFSPASDPGWRLSGRTPWRQETVLRAADGSFRLSTRRGESLEIFLQFYDPLAGAEAEVWQATLPADFDRDELVLPRRRGSVSGRATSGGRPIAGERVVLRSIEGAVLATGRTRPDGGFRIPFLPPGVYALAIGEPNVQILSLRDGQRLDLDTFDL